MAIRRSSSPAFFNSSIRAPLTASLTVDKLFKYEVDDNEGISTEALNSLS